MDWSPPGSQQEHWSGLPFPAPRDPPDPGIEPMSPTLAGGFLSTEPPEKPAIVLGWDPVLIFRDPHWNYLGGSVLMLATYS